MTKSNLGKNDIYEIERDTDNIIEVRDLENVYAYNNIKPSLQGSASKKIFQYYGDFDFLIPDLKKPEDPKILYKNFVNILSKINKYKGIYFIELKFQYLDGTKKKIYPKDKITFKDFQNNYKNLDFIKIDAVIYSNSDFTESSCIYSFKPEKMTETQITKSLVDSMIDDLKEYKKKKEYFKMIKRYFSIFSQINNFPKNILNYIVQILNSRYGQMYKDISRIKAYQLVDENYNDEITNARKYVFKNKIAGIPENIINQYSKEINNYAKPLIPNFEKILNEYYIKNN